MLVAACYNNNGIQMKEMLVPKIGLGELLVEVIAGGICGSDVMEWYRSKKAPLVLGREIPGEVTEIGGGTILFFAPPTPEVTLPLQLYDLWHDGITLTNTYAGSPDDIATAIGLIRDGNINVQDMITHRLGLAETGLGFQLVADARDSLKVIIEPQR